MRCVLRILTGVYIGSHNVLLIDPTVILGFEHELYNTSEGNGSIKVCIKVKDGVPQNLLHLSLTTVDGTAIGMPPAKLLVHIPTCTTTINYFVKTSNVIHMISVCTQYS